jgi:hypothetical protein
METPPKFPEYTSGKFWGGTVLPYWVLMIFTALPFTGFFGIDHLLFRSPTTALLKFVVNIFLLGIWYFYDIVQVFGDRTFIKEYGLTKPISGAAGLGLDYFRGVTGGKDSLGPSKSGFLSLLLFCLYLFATFIPFGASNFLAGDVEGGVGKFLLSFGPWGLIWIPFLFVAAFFEVYRNLTEPQKIFTEGAIRPPPLNLLLNSTGYSPNLMNPETLEKEAEKSKVSLYDTFVKPILSFFGIADPKEILDTTKCQVVPPIEKTVTAAKTAADGIAKVAATVPAVAQEATEKLSAFTDPAKLQQAAAAAAKVQTGGGSSSSALDYIFLGGIGFLIVGGLFATFVRKTMKRGDGEDAADDRPSQPQLLRAADGEGGAD